MLPSGRFLAAALARYVAAPPDASPNETAAAESSAALSSSGSSFAPPIGDPPPARRLLEVGPGTGAVTRRLARVMRADDRLDLVEINEQFVAVLRAALADDPALQPIAPRIRLLHGAIEDVPLDPPYDVIVSGLPLNNFAVAEVERILGRLAELLAPGGTLSFFEYMGVRACRAAVGSAAERARFRAISAVLEGLFRRGRIRRDWVWLNIPPAWVHHVRLAGA